MKSRAESKSTIVVVDDEPYLCDIISYCLEEEHFNTKVFSSPLEVISFLESNKVDLIISDVQMPELNGKEMVAKIRENKHEMPVILITGFSKVSLENYESLGITNVISKPIDLEYLLSSVKDSLKVKA